MKAFLTLDVGTTAVKAALFDEKLARLGLVIREYTLLTPGPDLVELPAEVYWENAVRSIRTLLAETGVRPEAVASITCTTQGETLIPVDGAGNALHNAIVWLDSRPKEEAGRLKERYSNEAFYQVTGVPEINPYCPVAKLMWVKAHLPQVYAQAEKFLLLEDYLLYKLTGRFATNPAVMCTTGYFDIRSNTLWGDILEATGLDADKFPELLPCGTQVAPLNAAAAQELGLTRATIATTGAMDQVAAAIGAGNVRPGFLSETTGTCLAVGAATTDPALTQWANVPVYSHGIPGLYLKIMIAQTAGMALKWFRNEFCPDLMEQGENAYDRMSELAAQAPPLSRGVSLFPHFTGSYSDPDARGVFFGIGLDTGRDCFIRAIMESIGYALRESIELMGADCTRIHSMGGGAKSEVWNQIKADICRTELVVMQEAEAASLGAAMLGGMALGCFATLEEAGAHIATGKSYFPGPAADAYREGYATYTRMYDCFAPLFK